MCSIFIVRVRMRVGEAVSFLSCEEEIKFVRKNSPITYVRLFTKLERISWAIINMYYVALQAIDFIFQQAVEFKYDQRLLLNLQLIILMARAYQGYLQLQCNRNFRKLISAGVDTDWSNANWRNGNAVAVALRFPVSFVCPRTYVCLGFHVVTRKTFKYRCL